nr:hypothetical protein Iba_chr14aCG20870 [Ipomoea batatas]
MQKFHYLSSLLTYNLNTVSFYSSSRPHHPSLDLRTPLSGSHLTPGGSGRRNEVQRRKQGKIPADSPTK